MKLMISSPMPMYISMYSYAITRPHTFILFGKLDNVFDTRRYRLPYGAGSFDERSFPPLGPRTMILGMSNKTWLNFVLDDAK